MVEHDDDRHDEQDLDSFELSEDFSDIEALFGEHRDAVDPGDHFFEALEQDIMSDVARTPQGDQPVDAAPPVQTEPPELNWPSPRSVSRYPACRHFGR